MPVPAFFSAIPVAPKDPILGMSELFNADSRPEKVNLGIGVYTDENGKVPVLDSVRRVEEAIEKEHLPRSYLPMDGIAAYNTAVKKFLFGELPEVLPSVVTVQTLAGTGALRLAAEFVSRFSPVKEVWISSPTWDNHFAVFGAAGFDLHTYPYFDNNQHCLDFAGFSSTLKQIPKGATVVLQACCHNPTGADPTPEQWQEIISIVKDRSLIPVIDIAYQGFARGVKKDGEVLKAFALSGVVTLVANSFSKIFSLYSERIGALSVVCTNPNQAAAVLSQLKLLVRSSYSNPAFHGGQVVMRVLTNEELRKQWLGEVDAMRNRIQEMRTALVKGLGSAFDFVNDQYGMFSYSGLSSVQMQELRSEFAVYGLDSGRICVAALNHRNLPHVIDAIKAVL